MVSTMILILFHSIEEIHIKTVLFRCLEATSTHPDTQITDFTSSFRDGMAINILIKSFDDQLVDLQEICELRGEDRIENALSLARRHFNVPKLVQPKDFYSEHLDMKSVACYLMMVLHRI